MKVRLTLNVDARQRYVIAKYFGAAADGKDRSRVRATRAQVRRFAAAALRSAVADQAAMLRDRRQRTVATRLGQPAPEAEMLPEPAEKQLTLI